MSDLKNGEEYFNNRELFPHEIERIVGASWPTNEARKACDEVFEYHGNHSPYAAYVQGFVDGINYGLQHDVGQADPPTLLSEGE